MKKRIAIFAGYYFPKTGGYIKNIHELAKRLTKEGYSVDVITCNTEQSVEYEKLDEVNVFRLPSWDILGGNFPIPKPTFSTLILLKKLFKKDYVVFNIHTRFFVICTIGWIISLFKRKPLIYLERGSTHSIVTNKIVNIISKTYDHLIGYLIVKTAKFNLGVSKASTKFLEHLGANNATVMYNGIDISLFEDISPYANLKTNEFINITFVGRLIYAKGVQDLISIFPELPCKLKLIIVGDGSYRSELEKMSKKYENNDKNIIFLGNKEIKEIPAILKSTDIFVNPSYSEGLPTSVMEACAAGCAVIATDVGGTNEIIEDNVSGLLYAARDRNELKDKITHLIENPHLIKKFGNNAKINVKDKFSWNEIILKWKELIEDDNKVILMPETLIEDVSND